MMGLRDFRRLFSKVRRQPAYAFKVFKKRSQGYLYYWCQNGRSSYPEAITLFLTHRCNLRCKMCGQWGEAGVNKRAATDLKDKEMSFLEWKNLVDELNAFKPNITLFGGEPLLHPDCLTLIKYIKDRGMHCLLITNGSLLNEFARELVATHLDELNVSLDGAKDLHEQIRGMPGLFERITKGLKEINRIKKEKGLKSPLINLQCTISKYNYRNLEELLDVAEDLEADSLTYHNLIFLSKDLIEKQKVYDAIFSLSSRDWEGFVFSPEITPEILASKIREIRAKEYSFSVDFYPNFSAAGLKEYYNSVYLPREFKARCLSPWINAYIFADGQLRPCLNFDYSFGNINKQKFTEAWNSAKALHYRRVLKKKKIFPVCARCTELYRY